MIFTLRRRAHMVLTGAALVTASWSVGCDVAFVPIQPGDIGFSVHGFLDASADTQWIRLVPLREVAVTTRGPTGATVFLENLATGQVIEMRDSVFRFPPPGPEVGSEGIFVHNFWTAEAIEPGAAYRLTAQREGVPALEAATEIPPEYTMELWAGQGGRGSLLVIEGVPRIAWAGLLEHYTTEFCGEGWWYRPFRNPRSDSDPHAIVPAASNIAGPSPPSGCGRPIVFNSEIAVFGSVTPWPSGPGTAPGSLGEPERPSNLTHAVGFLGGVVSRHVPSGNCQLLGPDPPPYCVLRYEVDTASVSGRVRDGDCGMHPVPGALFELEELGDTRNPRRRFVNTNGFGEFGIHLLEGRVYAVRVTRPPDYRTLTDTIEVAEGQAHTYDVVLTRWFSCPDAP